MERVPDAKYVIQSLGRLTLLRGMLSEEPIKALFSLADYAQRGMYDNAENVYHALCAALLTSGVRRACGNIFCDYILHYILERENSFSTAVLHGFVDTPTYAAMKSDLDILLPISKLTTSDIAKWFDGTQQNGAATAHDSGRVGETLWGGMTPTETDTASAAPSKKTSSSRNRTLQLFEWEYEDTETADASTAEPALFDMYRLLMRDNASSTVIDDLWTFFDEFGTGIFLSVSSFKLQSGKLVPYVQKQVDTAPLPCMYDSEYDKIEALLSGFSSGSDAPHIQIYGARGLGKSASVACAIENAGKLKGVYVNGIGLTRDIVISLLETLFEQPQKFVLVLDSIENDAELICSDDLYWDNVALVLIHDADSCATCKAQSFMERIDFAKLGLDDFAAYLYECLAEHEPAICLADIKNACADYQLETHLPLDYRAARAIMRMLVDTENNF